MTNEDILVILGFVYLFACILGVNYQGRKAFRQLSERVATLEEPK